MASADLSIGIREFKISTARPSEYRALNRFINAIRREGWPAEDLTTADELACQKRSVAIFERQHLWGAWQGDSLIGLASFHYPETSTNRHAAEFLIEVAPPFRRRGLATRLLQPVVEAAADEAKTLLLTWTSSLVPAAGAFMRQLRAQEAQVMSINQLDVADYNQGLAQHWLERAQPLAERLSFGFWDGAYPEADLDAIVEMRAVMNTMPRDKLALEDELWTVAQLREQETALEEQGIVRHTAYVRSTVDGRIAGFTETFWNAARPEVLTQGDTAVSPQWRNLGIATWLKAGMMQRLLLEHPTVRRVSTWNGVTNAPMLRINQQLGFRPSHEATNWQLTRGQLERYVMGRDQT